MANSHPAQDITAAWGHPNHPMNEPLSSYMVPGRRTPEDTDVKDPRASTYAPYPQRPP